MSRNGSKSSRDVSGGWLFVCIFCLVSIPVWAALGCSPGLSSLARLRRPVSSSAPSGRARGESGCVDGEWIGSGCWPGGWCGHRTEVSRTLAFCPSLPFLVFFPAAPHFAYCQFNRRADRWPGPKPVVSPLQGSPTSPFFCCPFYDSSFDSPS